MRLIIEASGFPFFEVLARPIHDCPVEAYGCQELVELTEAVVPLTVRKTLAVIQTASLDLKVKYCQVPIGIASAAAGLVGLSPIPFTDCAGLVPIFIGMIASISLVFGLKLLKKTYFNVFTIYMGGMTGKSMGGRALVITLIKFIPGVGTGIGGALAAASGAAMTVSFGEFYIGILKSIYKTIEYAENPDEVVLEEVRKNR